MSKTWRDLLAEFERGVHSGVSSAATVFAPKHLEIEFPKDGIAEDWKAVGNDLTVSLEAVQKLVQEIDASLENVFVDPVHFSGFADVASGTISNALANLNTTSEQLSLFSNTISGQLNSINATCVAHEALVSAIDSIVGCGGVTAYIERTSDSYDAQLKAIVDECIASACEELETPHDVPPEVAARALRISADGG